MRSWRASKYK